MIMFACSEDLFMVLKVKHILYKHWSDYVGSKIIKCTNELLLKFTQIFIIVSNFLFINVDEVITINNTS
jgi:hypothetical protein